VLGPVLAARLQRGAWQRRAHHLAHNNFTAVILLYVLRHLFVHSCCFHCRQTVPSCCPPYSLLSCILVVLVLHHFGTMVWRYETPGSEWLSYMACILYEKKSLLRFGDSHHLTPISLLGWTLNTVVATWREGGSIWGRASFPTRHTRDNNAVASAP